MKRTPIVRRTPLKRSTKPIPRVSAKQRARHADYAPRAQAFKKANPTCQVCNHRRTDDVHHKSKRSGPNMSDESTFLAVCRTCHNWIHENPGSARKMGCLE